MCYSAEDGANFVYNDQTSKKCEYKVFFNEELPKNYFFINKKKRELKEYT